MTATTTRGYATPAEALAEALRVVAGVSPDHHLGRASFGEFSDRVGGGFYYDLTVNYTLGNTKDGIHPNREPADLRTRKIVEAFQEKFDITKRPPSAEDM